MSVVVGLCYKDYQDFKDKKLTTVQLPVSEDDCDYFFKRCKIEQEFELSMLRVSLHLLFQVQVSKQNYFTYGSSLFNDAFFYFCQANRFHILVALIPMLELKMIYVLRRYSIDSELRSLRQSKPVSSR